MEMEEEDNGKGGGRRGEECSIEDVIARDSRGA
jgi:hypothetical protein